MDNRKRVVLYCKDQYKVKMQLQKEIKLIGIDDYDRQISTEEMKTEGIHQKLNKNNRQSKDC